MTSVVWFALMVTITSGLAIEGYFVGFLVYRRSASSTRWQSITEMLVGTLCTSLATVFLVVTIHFSGKLLTVIDSLK
jgi:hypothetical protein